jgi:hypothetical protein
MKYRIKVVTFKNGRQTFFAQVKSTFFWKGLSYDGEAILAFDGECDTREIALKRIDKHFEGNTTKHSIEFEYITK